MAANSRIPPPAAPAAMAVVEISVAVVAYSNPSIVSMGKIELLNSGHTVPHRQSWENRVHSKIFGGKFRYEFLIHKVIVQA